jgi:hypothetical protein
LTPIAAALMAVPIQGFAVVAAVVAVAVEHRRTSSTGLVADWLPGPPEGTGAPGILGRP